MPDFDQKDLSERESYFLLTSSVVPRPIAWVSSVSGDGVRNLAPYSYFNAASSDPPIVHVTSSSAKDTLRNVQETGQFVVNIVDRNLAEEMNYTATDFPPGEDEFAWADLAVAPSRHVAVPRVARAKVALECTLRQVLKMGRGTMMFGDVVGFHVADDVWVDGRIDPAALQPVGRLGGALYSATSEDSLFRMKRRSWAGMNE